jgi:hypothetical protein
MQTVPYHLQEKAKDWLKTLQEYKDSTYNSDTRMYGQLPEEGVLEVSSIADALMESKKQSAYRDLMECNVEKLTNDKVSKILLNDVSV